MSDHYTLVGDFVNYVNKRHCYVYISNTLNFHFRYFFKQPLAILEFFQSFPRDLLKIFFWKLALSQVCPKMLVSLQSSS